MGNFKSRTIEADLTEALYKGIEIPTIRQIPSGYFKIKFQINGNSRKKYYYKIYYQNESYKFSENIDTTTNYNPLAEENFYGSWEDCRVGFKPIENRIEKIIDSIRIVGNPRDEKKYYGPAFENSFWNEEDIKDEMQKIKSNATWYAEIKEKAKHNKITADEQILMDAKWNLKTNPKAFSMQEVNDLAEHIKGDKKWYESILSKAAENKISAEEQLVRDAKWMLAKDTTRTKQNNRWKRNPRMGIYSLMIVVATEEDLAKIPVYIQNIGLTSDTGNFINPYYFFKNKKNLAELADTKVYIDTAFITVSSSLNLSSGIYANGLEAANIPSYDKCAWTKDLYMNAHFSQFFSTLAKDLRLNTIPHIQDVNDSSYSLKEYENSLKKFSAKDFVKDYIRNTDKPCEYVKYNPEKKSIEIITPGNNDLAHARKTNMGVKTRIGFTYGKITAKIKFPELINKDNVWNGLTNAFWLLFQDEHQWNDRRICKTGYTQKGDNRNDAPRAPQTHYSEIDFEMVKTSQKWPGSYYKGNKNFAEQNEQQTDDIVVACTNWDMTCKDCKWYTVGLDTITQDNSSFETFRWDGGYQALTTRTAAKDDELFKSPFYYYQFEWTPNYIVWRIGSDKNNLRIVGCMRQDITSIPNNQMVAVITQEYHLSEWWPPIPFKQEYIPYPKSDIKGEVYEITVE